MVESAQLFRLDNATGKRLRCNRTPCAHGAVLTDRTHIGALPLIATLGFFYALGLSSMAGCAGTLAKVCRFQCAGLATPYNPPPNLLTEIVAAYYLTLEPYHE